MVDVWGLQFLHRFRVIKIICMFRERSLVTGRGDVFLGVDDILISENQEIIPLPVTNERSLMRKSAMLEI